MQDLIYHIVDGFDKVFDEKGNCFLAFRKITWGEKTDNVKLDMRKWYNNKDGGESVGKGFSFLTDEGPNELAKILVEEGYGDTDELIELLNNRVPKEEDDLYDPELMLQL